MENKGNKKTKRFYKVGEIVWVVDHKTEGVVKSIDRANRTVTVEIADEEVTVNLWSIDKLKYKAKEKLVKEKSDTDKIIDLLALIHAIMYPEVFFAKVREDAVIPSKREEDAGYDIYANLEDKFKTEDGFYEIDCPVLATTLVPTGLAVAMPNTHYLNLKHERGSTGVQSMSVLAGVIDSGFRNEMFIALTPLHKHVIITNRVDKVVVQDDYIMYPLSKAVAQGTVDLVPKAKISELPYEELLKIESERGLSMLGASGK
ncbi:dUTP diphosphatase [Priestia aryabhattai]|uniref:dUTP diphosphatase n=1 Tax=Priestia aryabhattai TaxID=412384 RepID=UPI0039A247EB